MNRILGTFECFEKTVLSVINVHTDGGLGGGGGGGVVLKLGEGVDGWVAGTFQICKLQTNDSEFQCFTVSLTLWFVCCHRLCLMSDGFISPGKKYRFANF